jgi:hypothetical protein
VIVTYQLCFSTSVAAPGRSGVVVACFQVVGAAYFASIANITVFEPFALRSNGHTPIHFGVVL